ncbi:MAG: pyruvate ferredoxin oxidoreductase, partial [Euryarchaeota archaeon]|nr:pyruvate ferredoxin oxidoreductase [Euryarchaeota archaeon]
MEALNVVISGIGGQGVVLASDILADAAIKNGLKIIG